MPISVKWEEIDLFCGCYVCRYKILRYGNSYKWSTWVVGYMVYSSVFPWFSHFCLAFSNFKDVFLISISFLYYMLDIISRFKHFSPLSVLFIDLVEKKSISSVTKSPFMSSFVCSTSVTNQKCVFERFCSPLVAWWCIGSWRVHFDGGGFCSDYKCSCDGS